MTRRTIAWLAGCFLLFFSACGAKPPVSEPEPTLEQQIARVKSGAAKEIYVRQQPVSDADLAPLAELATLETLLLEKTTLTDASALRIAKLPQLTRLAIGSSRWTNQAIASLTQSKVNNLRLGDAPLDDEGLAHLSKLTGLRFLILRDLPITDRALAPIGELPQLESLYISGTKITEAGLAELQKKRPKLHIHGP